MVRRQVGGVAAGVGLLVLARRIFELDLRGIVEDVAAVWTQYVGGFTSWLLHWSVEVPLSLIGLHYRFPTLLTYYISIGILVCLSVTRAMSGVRQPVSPGHVSWKRLGLLLAKTVAVWIPWIMVWPLTLLSAVLMGIPALHARVSSQTKLKMLRPGEELPPSSTGWLVFAPLFVAGGLLILSSLL